MKSNDTYHLPKLSARKVLYDLAFLNGKWVAKTGKHKQSSKSVSTEKLRNVPKGTTKLKKRRTTEKKIPNCLNFLVFQVNAK